MNDTELIKKYTNILLSNGIKDTISKVIIKSPDDLIGEHGGSIIEYVTVHYEDKEKNPQELFVKKLLPTADSFQKQLLISIMLNEGKFLTNFVSQIAGICEEKLGTENDVEIRSLFPKTFHADESEIIMENIVSQDYFMLKKKELQNFEIAKLVMLNLAKLHGTSFCVIKQSGGKNSYVENNPNFKEMFGSSDPAAHKITSGMFDPTYDLILRMLKIHNSTEALDIYHKLDLYTGKFATTLAGLINSQSIYDVVNHGDFWNNNIMFSPELRNNPELAKIIFVDFQWARVTSPALDISHYLFTSVKPEVRKRTKELLQIYFDAISDLVLRLGEDFPYTFEELLHEYSVKSKFGLLFGLFLTLIFESTEGRDTTKSERKLEDGMSELMSTWAENNPNRVDEIVEIVKTKVNDFEIFGQL